MTATYAREYHRITVQARLLWDTYSSRLSHVYIHSC